MTDVISHSVRAKVLKRYDCRVQTNIFSDEVKLSDGTVYISFALLAEFSEFFQTLISCETDGPVELTGTSAEWTAIMNYCYSDIITTENVRCDLLLQTLDKIMFDATAVNEFIAHIIYTRQKPAEKETSWHLVPNEYVKQFIKYLIIENDAMGKFTINKYVEQILAANDPKYLIEAYSLIIGKFSNNGPYRFRKS